MAGAAEMSFGEPTKRATRERDPHLGFPAPGEVLRRLRSQRGMSLRQVSAQCGISVSFLATLERGETDIALERLARLADVFGHDVGSFLGFSRKEVSPSIFPVDELESLERAPGVHYRVLHVPHTGYQIIQAEFAPGCGAPDDIQHEGTDLLVVTDGTLTLRYRGRNHVLQAGDCGLWSAGHPHAFRNDGEETARGVFFLTSELY